ncbi:NADH-quinone oxidoreductase subunit M [Amycolatopsis sp. SID8362]|uniref:NADH-quinone oxidoreductase subunit M n=1 Tax=Amycolatopsis sp. SID8362 TaxID=2690346 RepID=UPI00136E4033|nr:NADH-quinone oxidoreductase subunit M [Amycolatopsis sp. SID8362]NBH04367.1 NADH-quinone oxidoreductase subunit M [Amycolatopsis sp. SID8362]NED41066.1 NADH-quinone oxidoreductase subunit M [Amycolatopsis sp. SID8362]
MFPWLSAAGVVPLAGSLLVAVAPARLAKVLALICSLATLGVVIAAATRYQSGGPRFQLVEHHSWVPAFGVSYAVGVDGVALVLIGLAAVLTPVVLLAADARTARGFFALVLALETTMIVVFAATDVFLFYVFFEAMLIPMYFLIGRYGGERSGPAALKFLLYSLTGGLLMLVAVLVLGRSAGTFDFAALAGRVGNQRWLFLGFFVAFAIKAPLWPFHGWLPDAAEQATPTVAVLLIGVLDKVGTFGMLRYCLTLFPEAAHYFTPLVVVLSLVGVVYGALVAIGQTDIVRLVAYTSVSHFGFITLGVFAMTPESQAGSALYMVSHGLTTAALLLIAGFLISRRGSRRIDDYGGVVRVAPVLAGLFLFAGLATLALPGLSGFTAEFLVLVGTFAAYPVAAVIGVLGVVLAAIYVLWLYQRTMTGPITESVSGMRDLGGRERWVMVPLVALILFLGLYPQPVLDVVAAGGAR